MSLRIRLSPLVLALAAIAITPAQAARHRAPAHHPAAPALNQAMLTEQVLLARAGFSPGIIDARGGDNTDNALHAFQQANGLPVGHLDPASWAKLSQGAGSGLFAQYVVQPGDVAGPFAPQIPKDYAEMGRLPRLSYRDPRQLLAEKFHISEELLAGLNPGKDLAQAGTVITVADVGGSPSASPDGAALAASSGSSTPLAAKVEASRVVVDKRNHAVLVYDAGQRLIAFYPASIGSAEKPAPSGTFQVRSVARNPTYTYSPAYAFRGQTAQKPVTVAPGPNNPVGLVWIGLSLKGYGIHGTPEPDKVGKTQSHGCVRLTNWDALALAALVKAGTPVAFVG